MNQPARILHLGPESAVSADLAERLRLAGLVCAWLPVNSIQDLREARALERKDALIADESHLDKIDAIHREFPDLPIAVISEHPSDEAAARAIDSGACDYLSSREPARLGATLRRAFANPGLRREKETAEQALKEVQSRLRELVENLTEIFWVADPRSRALLYVSPAFETLWGRRSGDYIRDPFSILETIHPDDCSLIKESWNQQANGQRTSIEFRIRRPDGAERWIWARTFPVFDSGGVAVRTTGIAADVTDAKRAQSVIMENQARLAGLIASAMDAIVSVDEHMRIVLFNAAAETMFGSTAEEMHGRPLDDLLPVDFAWQRESSWLSFGQTGLISRIMGPVGEIIGRRANGESFPLEASISQTVAGGHKLLTLILRDVTERRQSEDARQKLESQLRRAQKLEAIGTLAGGIAHDFNNILGAVLGHMDLLEMDLPKDHPCQESVVAIQKAARRGADLVRQMLTFSRAREQPRVRIDLRTLAKEVLKLVRSSLPASIEIISDLPENIPSLMADAAQIQQLILNLAMNAAQAMQESGGRIEISVASLMVDADLAASIVDLRTGSFVRISVRDDGPGMDAVTLEHLFEPFFTTKSPGEGSGLGLAVVHGIVRNHGGAIHVTSEVGRGARFDAYLPAIEPPPAAEPKKMAEIPRGHGERILFVDDEPALTRVSERLLEALGYRASTFNRPEDALTAFERAPGDFDAVIADLTMPGMSGLDFSRKVLTLSPHMPILLATGYVGVVEPETIRQFGLRGILAKPVTADEVAQALHQILNGASASLGIASS